MSKTALILVDIQNDYFPAGKWEVEGMQAAAENAARLLRYARRHDLTVVHVRHESLLEDPPFFKKGSTGALIHSLVAPHEGELVILKHRPNSFQGTDLRQILEERDISRLMICGAMSQMCIDATSRAACDLGYDVVIAEDACAARAQEFNGVAVPASQVHATIMSALAMAYGDVQKTAEILA